MIHEPTLFDLHPIEKPQPSYFNTSGHKGNDLACRIIKAEYQKDKILEIFRKHKTLSAYVIVDVFKKYTGQNILVTSVRRSLNTLERLGKIVNTNVKRETPFNGVENIYQIKFKRVN